MKKQRPVNLDLMSLHFPVTAILSILHRVSGVILFLLIPFLLWLLDYSLSSQDCFTKLAVIFDCFWMRLFIWVSLSSLIYHVIAGVRHLLMDIHIGESLAGARAAAWAVMFFSFALIILLGLALIFDIRLI